MPLAIRIGEGDLFEYNSKYRLLICRECQYAIQKTALESHLLRHKIYRGDRQRLLSSIAQLDLLEPQNVPLPASGSPPVNALPILPGYRCTAGGCQHLTSSSKRIKRHWSEIHALRGSVTLPLSFARPAKLQTFFRGTKVRYFEVASPTAPLVNDDDEGDEGDDDYYHEGYDDQGRNVIKALPPSPPCVPTPSETTPGPPPTDINMETLTYFHHFIAVTSLTLPGAEDSQSTKRYWQTYVVSQALRRRWLMCGLLAISAHHLAVLTDNTMPTQTHREREAQFSAEFSSWLELTTGCGLGFKADEMQEAKTTGEQIGCLLRCAQYAWTEPTTEEVSVDSSQLLSIVSNIRNCHVPDHTLENSGIQNDGRESQEEMFVSRSLQTRNSSVGVNTCTSSTSDKTPPVLLDRLHALPFRIADVFGRPESTQEVLATLSAITALVECCAISFACDEVAAAWQSVATWLASVPDYFNQMLSRNHPAALVVLAHWAAILVKRAERVGCWFLKGSAKIIVLQIARQLSVNGHAVLGLVESLMFIVNA
jgi:hypothetical protein